MRIIKSLINLTENCLLCKVCNEAVKTIIDAIDDKTTREVSRQWALMICLYFYLTNPGYREGCDKNLWPSSEYIQFEVQVSEIAEKKNRALDRPDCQDWKTRDGLYKSNILLKGPNCPTAKHWSSMNHNK